MRRHFFYSVVLMMIPLLLSDARAADQDGTDANIRCLVVAFTLSNSQDQNAKTAGFLAALYWFGRLDGLGAPRDLEDQMVDVITKMTPDDLRSEGMRCGEVMRIRGQAIKEMGQHLGERGEKLNRQQQNPTTTP